MIITLFIDRELLCPPDRKRIELEAGVDTSLK